MDPANALAFPRLHDQIAPQETHLEEGWDREIATELERLGHRVKWLPGEWSIFLAQHGGSCGLPQRLRTLFRRAGLRWRDWNCSRTTVAPTTACGVSYNPDTNEWKAAGEPRRKVAGGEVV